MIRRCCCCLAWQVLLVSCALLLVQVFSATPPPPPTTTTVNSYNCSHSYTLRVNSSRLVATGDSLTAAGSVCLADSESFAALNVSQCVESSQDGFQRCSSLSGILTQFVGVIESGDCLKLELEPGEFVIPPTSTTVSSVNYSLVVVAPSGGVTVSCKSSLFMNTNSSCTSSSALIFVKGGGERDKVWVAMDGVKFEDCQRPFQFDDMDHVTFINCSFR